jgi:hypothetical protein
MSKKEFTDFISRQQARVEASPINWVAEKEEWLEYLNDLYQMVERFLKEYTDKGQIILTYAELELEEENIGRYTVHAMALSFGTNRVTLTPIGTLLIGTKGRVDMIGPRGTRRLLLADKNSTGIKVVVRAHVLRPGEPLPQTTPEEVRRPNWEWKIIMPNAPPQASYQQLTQDTFFDALMEISNG